MEYFVTFATHESRISLRMIAYNTPSFIKGLKPITFDETDRWKITGVIADVIERHGLKVITYNVS